MSVEDLDTDTDTSGEDPEIPKAQGYTINLTISHATRCEHVACIQVLGYRSSCAFRLRSPRHTPTEMYLAEWLDIYPNMVGESCFVPIIDPETGQIGATCCSLLSTGRSGARVYLECCRRFTERKRYECIWNGNSLISNRAVSFADKKSSLERQEREKLDSHT